MPDLYTRVQSGTKASTLGTILTLLGIGLIHLSWIGKIIVLILFVLLTNPISSHVLGRAAHYIKEPMSNKTITDQLRKNFSKEQSSKEEEDL